MNLQTPLTEVAEQLPAEAARLMLGAPPNCQIYVVKRVREAMVHWEQRSILLDPVQAEAVLTEFVTLAMGAWYAVVRVATEKEESGA